MFLWILDRKLGKKGLFLKENVSFEFGPLTRSWPDLDLTVGSMQKKNCTTKVQGRTPNKTCLVWHGFLGSTVSTADNAKGRVLTKMRIAQECSVGSRSVHRVTPATV